MQLAGLTLRAPGRRARFGAAPDGVGFPRLTARAIVGGVRHVVFTRMLERRERELYALTDEVLDWIECLPRPRGARLRRAAAQHREPCRPRPPRSSQRDDKRARVLGSVVHLTLDEGYARLTDPQIAQFAGISTEAFHKQFPSKEECFLAVLDEFVARSARVGQAQLRERRLLAGGRLPRRWSRSSTTSSPTRRCCGSRSSTSSKSGPAMVGRMTRSVESFTELLTENGPEPRRGPMVAREAVTGALWAIISSYVAARPPRASCRAWSITSTFIVLAPYLGPKAGDRGDPSRTLAAERAARCRSWQRLRLCDRGQR